MEQEQSLACTGAGETDQAQQQEQPREQQQQDAARSRAKEDGKKSRSKDAAAGVAMVQVPLDVFRELTRKPFRKRHPVLFFLLLSLCAIAIGALAGKAYRADRSVPDEPVLALVSVNGAIRDITGQLAWIEKIGRDENVKGVLLRVASPGGGAAASQELYSALVALAEKKPVAVSMGSSAASGGLMVSMAGHRIFANASTVTGSIGVRMEIPQVYKLMETLGVGRESLTTGAYKDAGSPMRPLSPAERSYFEGVLKDMHDQFVDIVARGRKMEVAEVAKLADGRIFTGRKALELGLVDELGGMAQAHDWLCKETGVDRSRKLVRKPAEGSWLSRQLSVLLHESLTTLGNSTSRLSGEEGAFLYQW